MVSLIPFQKQDLMRRVMLSLLPLIFFSLYLYGYRSLLILVVVFISGILCEYWIQRIRKKEKGKVTEAVMVTCTLYALSLPPSLGELGNLWIAVVGIVFAIVFAKEAYGGFGRNIFNPAIAGRLFVFLAFPSYLTGQWYAPSMFGLDIIDGVTTSTPLALFRINVEAVQGASVYFTQQGVNIWDLFLGWRAGSLGESSALLILLSAAYLVYTKTAQLRLMLSTLLGAFLVMAFVYYLGPFIGLYAYLNPFLGLFSGSILFVAVFMATEPVTAPNKPLAQWIYGILIGATSMIIRLFAGFPEGSSFGVLLGNSFASFIDQLVPSKKKLPSKSKTVTAGGAKPVEKEKSS